MSDADADRRTVVCFDADVVIYAAMPNHPLGPRVHALMDATDRFRVCGSTLLLPETLTKPTADEAVTQLAHLNEFIARLELWPVTDTVGRLAVWMGSTYRLRSMDATHLACAVDGGADVFLTNNRKDFDRKSIGEVDIVFPDELPAPTRRRRGRAAR